MVHRAAQRQRSRADLRFWADSLGSSRLFLSLSFPICEINDCYPLLQQIDCREDGHCASRFNKSHLPGSSAGLKRQGTEPGTPWGPRACGGPLPPVAAPGSSRGRLVWKGRV